MEILVFEVDHSPFPVHLELEGNHYIKGSVFSGYYWTSGDGKASGWGYMAQDDRADDSEELPENPKVLFTFSYCWRGVWEGRMYFKDDEYWSSDLGEMSKVWEQLEPELKKRIHAINPNADIHEDTE